MPINTWFDNCEQQRITERWRDLLELAIPDSAYRDVIERQANRDVEPLSDSRDGVQRDAADRLRRMQLASAFGNFIAFCLSDWAWFINPISFRDRNPDLERNPKTGQERSYRSIGKAGGVKLYVPDPQLKAWIPDYRGRRQPAAPVSDLALAEIKDYLFELQEAAGKPISWIISEEFGRVGGRHHCHLLVAGVGHLRRDEWWAKAFELFGRTRIEPFNPEQGAAFYCAKYAAKELGAVHFGGPLLGEPFTAVLKRGPIVGRRTVAPCPEMLRDEIRRSEFYPRGFSSWRSKR
jgi:hypothetical protein